MKKILVGALVLVSSMALVACNHDNFQTLKTTPQQASELYAPAGTAVMGKKDAPITMVEVFAYDCRYCRKDYPMVIDFVKSHPNVRIIFKPFKAFGERTQTLPQYAALAASTQGQFLTMHNALMTTNLPITLKLINNVAKELGLDINKLHQAMASKTVQDQIEKNTQLMDELNINGIPTIIVTQTRLANNTQRVEEVPQYIQTGFMSSDSLNKMVIQVQKDLEAK